jgi:lysozyme
MNEQKQQFSYQPVSSNATRFLQGLATRDTNANRNKPNLSREDLFVKQAMDVAKAEPTNLQYKEHDLFKNVDTNSSLDGGVFSAAEPLNMTESSSPIINRDRVISQTMPRVESQRHTSTTSIPSTYVRDTKKYEGWRDKVYKDTKGHKTIGYGHKLTQDDLRTGRYNNGITREQGLSLYNQDRASHDTKLYKQFPWIKNQPQQVRSALEDMAYNMGVGNGKTGGLSSFKNTLGNIRSGNYNQASKGVLASQYARDVGQRAIDNSELIRLAMLESQSLSRNLQTNPPSNDAISKYMESLNPPPIVDPRAVVGGLGLEGPTVDPRAIVQDLGLGGVPQKVTQPQHKQALASPSDSPKPYTAKKGDTLTKIAKKLGTTVKALQKGRKSDANRLAIGESFNYPTGSKPSTTKLPQNITVGKGDTLTKIAKRLGIDWRDIQKGRAKDADRLSVGETLDLSHLS